MLQDIYPHVFSNAYKPHSPEETDYAVLLSDNRILLKESGENEVGTIPTFSDLAYHISGKEDTSVFLFRIDDRSFYYVSASHFSQAVSADPVRFRYTPARALREIEGDYLAFGGAVAFQLAFWYQRHAFCGCCGTSTVHAQEERALVCPRCGQIYYPRISPVVIIAITDGDRILLTRYNRAGYKRHALVAGFVEIGETLEDAVRRETMEEVGIRVKNIRYVESQPWPFSSSLIAGFYAEADGSAEIHLNTDGGDELAEAVWVPRNEVVIEDDSVSLTWDLIRKFRDMK